MRLISLHEPWATLMALCYKRVETRDWVTHYRGPLAIHASKHGMSLQDTLDTCLDPVFYNALMTYEPFRNALLPYCHHDLDTLRSRPAGKLAVMPKTVMKAAFPNRGKILCVVDLKNIWPTATIAGRYPDIITTTELAFGNYDPIDSVSGNARQGWVTEMMFRLPEPVPFTSKQGLVDVPEDVRQELRRQWNLTNK